MKNKVLFETSYHDNHFVKICEKNSIATCAFVNYCVVQLLVIYFWY